MKKILKNALAFGLLLAGVTGLADEFQPPAREITPGLQLLINRYPSRAGSGFRLRRLPDLRMRFTVARLRWMRKWNLAGS